MAKRKTPKVMDLKPETVSNEQLKTIQSTVRHISSLQLDLGMIETKKHAILHQVMSTQNQIGELQGEFLKQYGTYDIDIETGKINYNKENGKINKKN